MAWPAWALPTPLLANVTSVLVTLMLCSSQWLCQERGNLLMLNDWTQKRDWNHSSGGKWDRESNYPPEELWVSGFLSKPSVFIAWTITALVLVQSPDSSDGLMNGICAPYWEAIFLTSRSSVLTIIESKHPAFLAISIDQAIIGFPRNKRTFFLGIRLLPPRAGIMQILILNIWI